MAGKPKLEIGEKYGELTVIADAGKSVYRGYQWLCLCSCGNTTTVLGTNLRRGFTQSCGHLNPKKRKNLIGKKYNYLTVISQHGYHGSHVKWLCRCDCGKECVVVGYALTRNKTKSCGCWRSFASKQRASKNNGESALNSIISQYKSRANKKNLKFELSQEQCVEIFKSDCYYCGMPPSQIRNSSRKCNGSYIYNGIDRRDNTRGYVIENVVPCCKYCNTAKSTMSHEEFIDLCKQVVNRHG